MGGGGIHPSTPPPPLVRPRVKRKQNVFSLFLPDHFWWRHRPPAAPQPMKYTPCFREDQHLTFSVAVRSSLAQIFHWMENRFEILQQIKNSEEGGGGVHQPPLYHGGDMTLSVRPRVKNDSLKGSPWWKSSNPNSGESWDLTWCLEVLSKRYIF